MDKPDAALPGVKLFYYTEFTGLAHRLAKLLGRVCSTHCRSIAASSAIEPAPKFRGLGALAGLLGQSLRMAGLQQGLSIASGLLILLLVAVPERYTGRAAAAVGLARLKQTLGYFFQQHSSVPCT